MATAFLILHRNNVFYNVMLFTTCFNISGVWIRKQVRVLRDLCCQSLGLLSWGKWGANADPGSPAPEWGRSHTS